MTNWIYGITIGPIAKSLLYASTGEGKTRKLHLASKLFSNLMRELIQEINTIPDIEWYLPDSQMAIQPDTADYGYPDRCIFSVNVSGNEIQSRIEKVKDHFLSPYNLIDYVKIDLVSVENTQNLAKDLSLTNQLLDTAELAQRPVGSYQANHHLDEYLKSEQVGLNHIRSIEKIALFQKDNKQPKHRSYIAFIQGDGDRIGKLIEQVKDAKTLKKLSHALLLFSIEASKKIEKFGGLCFYAGGDDVLAVSPIVNSHGDTVFSLVQELDLRFKKIVRDHLIDIDREDEAIVKAAASKVSFSAGLVLAYYQHPMNLLLEQVGYELFEQAKGNRNSVSIYLEKHSGSNTRVILNRANAEWVDLIIQYWNRIAKLSLEEVKEQTILSSIRPKLMNHHVLLTQAMIDSNFEHMIRAFFINQFNESDHDLNGIKDILEMVGTLLIQARNLDGDSNMNSIETMKERLQLVTDILYVGKFLMESGSTGGN